MIKFSAELGWWSSAMFFIVGVCVLLNAGFTLVVIVGGLRDLKFLLAAMEEEQVDESDDGRVDTDSVAGD